MGILIIILSIMAIFNVLVKEIVYSDIDFRASNRIVTVDTTNTRISELQINTETA